MAKEGQQERAVAEQDRLAVLEPVARGGWWLKRAASRERPQDPWAAPRSGCLEAACKEIGEELLRKTLEAKARW